MKTLLESGVPLVVSTVVEMPGYGGFSVLPRLSTPRTANNRFLSTSHKERKRQSSANAALMWCLSLSTGLVQYSLSADPQCPAAGNEPEELCSDHRGRRSASVRESHFPGEYGSSARRVPPPSRGRGALGGECCCGSSAGRQNASTQAL